MISCSAWCARGWRLLGSLSNTLARRCTQQRCSAVSGQTSRTAAQTPRAPIADGQHRRPQPPPLEIAQHRAPALRALPIAVLEADAFLGAVGAHADQEEGAQALLFHPDREVHAVRPEIDVLAVRQVPAAERLVLRGPRLRQPEDRARRQTRRVRPEQGGQRLPKVPRRQAVQVEQRQHARDPRRPPDVRRHDSARKLLAHAVEHAPVVHAGRRDGERPDARQDRPGARRPVAHDPRVPGGVALVAKARQVVVHLDLQRRGDHALRPDAGQVIQRRGNRRCLIRAFRRLSDKLQHRWRTFPPDGTGVLGVDCLPSPEGYVAFLSHPQLSTITRRSEAKLCRSECGEKCGGRPAALRTRLKASSTVRGLSGRPVESQNTQGGRADQPRLSVSVLRSSSRRRRARTSSWLMSTVRPRPLFGVSIRPPPPSARATRISRSEKFRSCHWRASASPSRSPVRARRRKSGNARGTAWEAAATNRASCSRVIALISSWRALATRFKRSWRATRSVGLARITPSSIAAFSIPRRTASMSSTEAREKPMRTFWARSSLIRPLAT